MKNQLIVAVALGVALVTGCGSTPGGTTTGSTTTTTTTSASQTASATPSASPSGGDEENAGELKVSNAHFSASDKGEAREDKTFKKGEVVWLFFDLEGFKTDKDDMFWVQEDLTVLDPEGNPVLQKENILDAKDKKGDLKSLPIHNDITIKEPVEGTYKINMTLRDKQGNQTTQFEDTFEQKVEEEGE